MKSVVIVSCAILLALFSAHVSDAKIWDWGCDWAIDALDSEQWDVEQAYNNYKQASSDLESAALNLESAESEVARKRRSFEWCTPSQYNDCEFERRQLNSAIDDYNSALEDYQSVYGDYESALQELNTEIEEFGDAVDELASSCLD